MPEKTDLRSLTPQALADFVRNMGAESYRERQIAKWVWQKGAGSVDEMTDLPLSMRERLSALAEIPPVTIVNKLVSSHGDAAKYLFSFADGEIVESVLMKHNYGLSACVSTQVGCRMGCRMCASGLNGLSRNLTPGEIYGQVMGMQKDRGERIGRVVIMGSGEPLDNYDNTLVFIKNITAPYGLNIGERHITLSTCGLAPQIKRLGREKLAVTLAVSLHGPNDALRNKLMPVNKKYPLQVLMESCRDYITMTGRRITFEYALINGVNDKPALAAELSKLVSGILCHVNLISVNPVPEHNVTPSTPNRAGEFKSILEKHGVTVSTRRKLGGDISAACGQLRRQWEMDNYIRGD